MFSNKSAGLGWADRAIENHQVAPLDKDKSADSNV